MTFAEYKVAVQGCIQAMTATFYLQMGRMPGPIDRWKIARSAQEVIQKTLGKPAWKPWVNQ
jgi:hypothetical protein